MPKFLSREQLALRKAKYKDGKEVLPIKPLAPVAEPKADQPAPTMQVVVDTVPIAQMMAQMGAQMQADMMKCMERMAHSSRREVPEEWDFDVTRDRFGRIEKVHAKAVKP